MRIIRFGVAFALVACSSSDSGKKPVDAAAAIDTPPAADAGSPDAASALCTGAVYDPCTSNDQCASQLCHLYSAASLQVCTQACGPGTPCPNDSTGAAVACNANGNCKPSVANNCHR